VAGEPTVDGTVARTLRMPARAFPRIAELRAFVRGGGQSLQLHSSLGEAPRNSEQAEATASKWIDGVAPWPPIASPMSVHDQYSGPRSGWGKEILGQMVVEVVAEDGTTGVGIANGGEPACFIVEKHLSRFVEGQDPRNIELMWDQMWRATINYGRKGLPIQAISAVDLALYDLLGKLRNEPVYALLGGKTKERVPCYCTTADPSLAQQLGFVGAKYPLAYGPAHGDEGLRKNREIHQRWRDAVGEDFPLMVDCYMSLTVPYAINLCQTLSPIGLKWMEEYLMPDDYAGHVAVKDALRGFPGGTLLATAEHEHTRYGYKQLLDSGAVDILQPDITWMGGITEVKRVIAMAAANNTLVIPHGSSVFSYHVVTAFQNCPMSEFVGRYSFRHQSPRRLIPFIRARLLGRFLRSTHPSSQYRALESCTDDSCTDIGHAAARQNRWLLRRLI
jgi:L-rhamnonate dehydratase